MKVDEGRPRALGGANECGVEDVAGDDAGIVPAIFPGAQDERARVRRDDDRAMQWLIRRERVAVHTESVGEGDTAAADQVTARLGAWECLPVDQRDMQPGPRQHNRRRAPARPGPDYRDIVGICSHSNSQHGWWRRLQPVSQGRRLKPTPPEKFAFWHALVPRAILASCVFAEPLVRISRETRIRERGSDQRARRTKAVAKSLYVGGLPYTTTESAVRELFTEVGEVSTVRLIMDRETGQSKGFAFVDMADDASASEAITKFNGYQFGGRSLVVNEARPREERTGGGGGGGYRGGGGGGGYGGGGGGYSGGRDRGGSRDY